MSATSFALPGLPPSSPPALVVQPILPHLLSVLSTLSALGFDVTVAETFKDARASLTARQPALLFTDVRLREYNGLHLVLRGRSLWPGLAAIVTSEIPDAVLQAEAEGLGATFMVMPTSREEMVAAVLRTMMRPSPTGESPAAIRAPFERRREERRAGSNLACHQDRRRGERRRDPHEILREAVSAVR